MKAGTYGAQSITAVKTAPGCTIIAESTTNIGTLTSNGAWYEIQNITASSGAWNNSSGNNITCRSCNFSGAQMDWGGTNISWIGGSFTNFTCGANCDHGLQINTGAGSLLFDGVLFDHIQNPTGPSTGQHFEVIRIDGNINGVTIRNSTFTNNFSTTSQIFFSNFQGSKPRNLLFENNFFGADLGPAFFVFNYNFQNSDVCSDRTFRYNTFKMTMMIGPASADGQCSGQSNIVWTGNVGPRAFGMCDPGTSWIHNVWYGTGGLACSGTDTLTSTAAMVFTGDGFHIGAGSAAIGNGGTGADCIATDHDGKLRSSPCDAGAIQFASGGSLPSAPQNFRIISFIGFLLGAGVMLGGLASGIRDTLSGWASSVVHAWKVARGATRTVA
jgi:hypothetical protein